MRTVGATRYVTPLHEGGSLPAIVEADDDGMYVLKFRGAGQGPKALIAELVAGEIARALHLPIPEIVLIELDPDLARTGPGNPGADQGQRGPQYGSRLPARRGNVRCARRKAGGPPRLRHRLVRCLCHERRSHAAQRKHADVAPTTGADRPWGRALLPS